MNKIEQVYDYNSKMVVKDELFTPLSGVRLNAGLYKRVFENNIKFLSLLNMGSMMYWFDIKTGTPTEAEPYKGHFEDNLKGSTLSMYLMGAANTLRWVDNDELREKVHILMERLRTAAEDDGFLMPVDKRRFAYIEYPHYVRIWLTYALCAVGLSCDEGAYGMLAKWQEWFNNCVDLPIIKYLVLAFQGVVASTHVYSTPVGTKRDIDVTIETYEEPWRLAQFMRREKNAVHIRNQPGIEPHAHGTETEAFEGYIDLYRATGRNYYLDAVLGAYELYKRDWQHAGGGIVMCEGMKTDNYPGCRWIATKNKYNELCCTSFWLHMCQRLHRLFPDKEEYMAEVEKSLFNIAFANQSEGDGIRYFAFMEEKKQKPGLVHCCCGVGTRIYGSLPEYIYSVSDDTLCVNLYTPSEIDWNGVTLVSEADIPYSEYVRLSLKIPAVGSGSASENGGKKFRMKLRIPCWTVVKNPAVSGDGCETAGGDKVEIYVNGQMAASGKPGSYVDIEREWQDGDFVTFRLGMDFRLTKYSGADELPGLARYAIEYGPVLYAVAGSDYKSARIVGWSISDYKSRLKPAGEPMAFDIDGKPGYRLMPYMDIGCEEEFTCYPVFCE